MLSSGFSFAVTAYTIFGTNQCSFVIFLEKTTIVLHKNLVYEKVVHCRHTKEYSQSITDYYLLDEFDDLEEGRSGGAGWDCCCMTDAGLGISMAVKPKLTPPALCNNTVSPELLTNSC